MPPTIIDDIKNEVETVLEKFRPAVETVVHDTAEVAMSPVGSFAASFAHIPPGLVQELGLWLFKVDAHFEQQLGQAAPHPTPTSAAISGAGIAEPSSAGAVLHANVAPSTASAGAIWPPAS